MNILGIETSCDETAAAVVVDGRWVRSHVVATSLKDHAAYGGVIPEIASRRQMEYILPVVEQALAKSELIWDEIDAIAVTQKPGLAGSLLVGISFARALSLQYNKPLIDVNHIEAHLYANWLSEDPDNTVIPQLPSVGLVVSGGHSSLYRITQWPQLELLGQTRDDAVGEAYDKVARLLNLGYPGGPIIDRLAQECSHTDISFRCAD